MRELHCTDIYPCTVLEAIGARPRVCKLERPAADRVADIQCRHTN